MFKEFARFPIIAAGFVGVILLAQGNSLGWLFLLAVALIALWLTDVIQRFWLELVGFSLLLAGVVLTHYNILSWGLAALLAGLIVCWSRTWWPYATQFLKK